MKRILILSLAAALICAVAATAYAVPSKTTQDLTVVDTAVTTTGEAPASDFVVETVPETPAVASVLTDMTAAVADDKPVINYFQDDVKTEIAKLLPADTDTTKLAINEVVPMKAVNYDEKYGDVKVSMTFATVYPDGQPLVALIGIISGDTTTWYPLQAEAVEGKVNITFTSEVLKLMETNEAVLAILG